jgi:hypothetical protein
MKERGAMTRHLAAGVLACAALLTACSGSSASASLQGPLLVSEGSGKNAMLVALVGPLTRIGTCIGLGERMVVWPEGVSWDDEQESLVLADGAQVPLGGDVYGSGGSMSASAVGSLFGSDAADALRECGVEAGSDVIVFNVGSDVSSQPVS